MSEAEGNRFVTLFFLTFLVVTLDFKARFFLIPDPVIFSRASAAEIRVSRPAVFDLVFKAVFTGTPVATSVATLAPVLRNFLPKKAIPLFIRGKALLNAEDRMLPVTIK